MRLGGHLLLFPQTLVQESVKFICTDLWSFILKNEFIFYFILQNENILLMEPAFILISQRFLMIPDCSEAQRPFLQTSH